MQQHGWQVRDIWAGDDYSAVMIGCSTTIYDYELLRRLLLAGLTQLEALAFWVRDVVDIRRGAGLVNDYLETSDKRNDAAHHLAEALDVSVEELSAAYDRAYETLRKIDANLPEFLADGRGGQLLPDELWSQT
jgi:hypothetical protein